MVKKRGFFMIIAFVLLFSGANIYLYLNGSNVSYHSMSGRYLEEFSELPLGVNLSLLIFILQWIVLLVVFSLGMMSYQKQKNAEDIKISYDDLAKKKAKAITPLDTFYDLMLEKKSLNVKSIAKIFSITKENALEWAKILENSELVRIEYPAFSPPEVKLNEKEDKTKTFEKEEEIPKKISKKEVAPKKGKRKERAPEKRGKAKKANTRRKK